MKKATRTAVTFLLVLLLVIPLHSALAAKPVMETAKVSWDVQNNGTYETWTYFTGMKGPVPITHTISDLEIREIVGGRKEISFIYRTENHFTPKDDKQIKAIASKGVKGTIGGAHGFCILDYSSGLNLLEANDLGVECQYEQTDIQQQKYTTSDGKYHITVTELLERHVTVTCPSSYDGLCIGLLGHNTAKLSKNDLAFWEGKVPFTKTNYYFSKKPELNHFLRLSDLNQ